MMSLGPYQFGMDTAAYQEFERSTSYTWAAQALYGKDDDLQATGPGEDTITLKGVVFPEFMGGIGQLDAMRALGAQQEPQTLIDGLGRVMGEWVIQSIDESGSLFAQRGIARKQDFTMKLRRAPAQQQDSGGGILGDIMSSIGSLPIPPTPLLSAISVASSATSGATGLLSSLGGSVSAITGMASQIGAQASGILSAVNGGINAARRLQFAGQDAARMLGGIGSVANIPSAMGSLVRLGGEVSQAAGVSSSILRSAGVDLSSASANPAAITAVRDSMLSVNRLSVLGVQVRSAAQSVLGGIL
jgi:phage protein U